MKQNKMFAAIQLQSKQNRRWLYAFLLPFIVQLVLEIGFILAGLIGYIAQEFFPMDLIYVLFDIVDPLFLQLLAFIVPLLLILLWITFIEKRPISGLGFYKKDGLKELLKGLLVGILLISAVVFSQWVTGSIELTGTYFSGLNVLNVFLIFPFWLLQSGTEEVSTRGWLFPGVATRTSLPIGVAASSLLFSLLHLGNNGISLISLLNIALFGLFACLYVLKTDNIWGISAAHAAWNCFQGSVFGVNVSGITVSYSLMSFEPTSAPTYLSGGEFGSEGSILASITLLLASLYLAWNLYQTKRKNSNE